MKNVMIRALGLTAISTSLLACVAPDDAAFEDELVSDGSELTLDDKALAAATPKLVPLVVELYQDFSYGGDYRKVIENEKILGVGTNCNPGLGFENALSSVRVRKGPDYDAWVTENGGAKPYVFVWEHNHFAGRRIALEPGSYPDLRELGFENLACSVQIVTSSQPPADLTEAEHAANPSGPIPAIVFAYTEPFRFCNEGSQGHRMTIVGTELDIGRDYGSAFENKISRFDIIPGTSFNPNKKFTVYEHPNFTGFHDAWYYSTSRVADLREHGLDNTISSIRYEQ